MDLLPFLGNDRIRSITPSFSPQDERGEEGKTDIIAPISKDLETMCRYRSFDISSEYYIPAGCNFRLLSLSARFNCHAERKKKEEEEEEVKQERDTFTDLRRGK